MLFYVKIHEQSCGCFTLSYVKVHSVYVAYWLYVKFVCGLIAISRRPPFSAASVVVVVRCRRS